MRSRNRIVLLMVLVGAAGASLPRQASAQKVVTPQEASQHVGEVVRVASADARRFRLLRRSKTACQKSLADKSSRV